MCDAIRHRGPDDDGYYVTDGVALGMRRLSIVDIAGGHQPMHGDDGSSQLVFNGEIFNHEALRAELKAAGATFRTQSDTEVILRLLEREGLAGLRRLNGMFAIAHYDAQMRRLTLVRDRIGVKPLYYYWDGSQLIFGSEIKAILAALPSRPEIEPRAIWDYLTFRYVPAPHTIWRNIFKLEPAHWLHIGLDDTEPVIERWWEYPRPGTANATASEAGQVRAFLDLLTDAVDLRMRADVPVGVLLSGGLDSSVIAALAAPKHPRLATFSVAFENAEAIDERRFARLIAKRLGTDHNEIVIGANEFVDFLPSFVHFTDEPLADLASVPLYYVSSLARRHVTVVLSGEGSDEILGGYSFDAWARRWDEAAEQARRGRSRLARFVRLMGAGSPDPGLLDLRRNPTPLTMTAYMTGPEKSALLRSRSDYPDSLGTARAGLRRFGDASPLAQALFTYCQDWLVEDLLMKADKMSMANSLELRTPFLDYRVVEMAARLPDALRVGRDASGTYQTKRILREMAVDLVPAEIISRPKMGFPVPVYDWLSGPLKPLAHDCLGSTSRLTDWCEPQALGDLLRRGTTPSSSSMDKHRLWNMMVLELWLRRWDQ